MADTIHRMEDNQLPAVLSLLANVGGTRRSEETWTGDRMTALLLGSKASPTAAMPMSMRQLQVGPGRSITAGWISSNMFPLRMGLRRQTRATEPQWSKLLPELDCIVAVRRDAPTLAGRWYTQMGFHPVLAIRCLYLDMSGPPESPVGRYPLKVIDVAEVEQWEAQMLSVHGEVFGQFGGYRARQAGFYGPALRLHFYREHYQFQIIGLWGGNGQTLMGYAVVGWSGWHSKQPRMDILEIATRHWDASVAQELIQAASQLAWSKNVAQIRAVVSVHDPYRPHLARVGFVDRWGYAMLAKWLSPQRYLDRLSMQRTAHEALDDLSVQLDSPGQLGLTLHAQPSGQSQKVARLQTDAPHLTRLLLQRLEVSAAVQDGTLLTLEATESDVSRVAMALPWTPWAFHMLDFI